MAFEEDSFKPEELSNESLLGHAKKIADVARDRGLEVFFVIGGSAIEHYFDDDSERKQFVYTRESVAEQLGSAAAGYNNVIESLNDGRTEDDLIKPASNEIIASEFSAWLSEEILTYLNTAKEADPEVRFTLVATPNILVNYQDLTKIAVALSQDPQHLSYSSDESFYLKYSQQQLSGTDPDNGNSIIFSLIPSRFTPGMTANVDIQQFKLAQLKNINPHLHVPRPLEALTYWYTLYAKGEISDDSNIEDLTRIRHFDLEEKPKSKWARVPETKVKKGGRADMDYSIASDQGSARLAFR